MPVYVLKALFVTTGLALIRRCAALSAEIRETEGMRCATSAVAPTQSPPETIALSPKVAAHPNTAASFKWAGRMAAQSPSVTAAR